MYPQKVCWIYLFHCPFPLFIYLIFLPFIQNVLQCLLLCLTQSAYQLIVAGLSLTVCALYCILH